MYLRTGLLKEPPNKNAQGVFKGFLFIVIDVEHLHVYTCVDDGHEINIL
jgi:hypothetical protein